jgi:hypothetical protein
MKLMWFHLMPYTELPADFRDANRRFGWTSTLRCSIRSVRT